MDRLTRGLVLALPAAFLAHDIGEVRGNAELNAALSDLAARSPRLSRVAASTRTSDRQMALAVSVLTSGCTAVSVRAVRRPPRSAATSDFAAVTAVVGGHVLGHVAQSLLLRRRVPGLVGALVVTVPYSVVALRRLFVRQYVDAPNVIRRGTVGLLALGPTLAALRLLARRVA